MIQMHSIEEHYLYGGTFIFLLVVAILIACLCYYAKIFYSLFMYNKSVRKARKELNRILRQLKKESEVNYLQQYEKILSTIEKGTDFNEQNIFQN